MAATTAQRSNTGFPGAINDLLEGARLWRLWFRLGLFETKNRYKRTILGPFWMASNTIAIGMALAFIRLGPGTGTFGDMLPYVVSGVMCWYLVGAGHVQGADTFIGAAGPIRSQPLPLSFHLYLQMWRMVIMFAHSLVGYYVVVLAFGVARIPNWSLPLGILLDLWAIFPSFYLLGLVSARYRDVGHAAGFIFQLLFFLSPIFWQPNNATGLRAMFVHHNPFAHLVNMIRYPIIGLPIDMTMVQWVVAYGAVCWVLLLIFLPMVRRRVVFWL